MTMRNDDGRRPVGVRDERGFGWGIPLAIAAVLIAGGLLFFNTGGSRTTTASNNSPAVTTNSGPAAPGAPVPGPTSTTPAPTR